VTLPEIPDEAVLAVLTSAGISTDFDQYPAARAEHEWARQDLVAAWPHLYAVALRHAAERMPLGVSIHSEDAAADLRRWADEASPRSQEVEHG
jgi:hypothetical protein